MVGDGLHVAVCCASVSVHVASGLFLKRNTMVCLDITDNLRCRMSAHICLPIPVVMHAETAQSRVMR